MELRGFSEDIGTAFVSFDTHSQAKKCVEDVNSKLFAGRRFSANIVEGQFETPQKTGKGGAVVSLETARIVIKKMQRRKIVPPLRVVSHRCGDWSSRLGLFK